MYWTMPRLSWCATQTAAALAALVFSLGTAAPTGFAQAPTGTPPAVPEAIQAPAGNQLLFVRHAIGTQDYVCLPSNGEFKFVLVTPRATLYDEDQHTAEAHYFSPNPFEGGVTRVTWENLAEGGTIWAQAVQSSSDASFVAPGAIAWVLLKVVATDGDDGTLTTSTYVQRLNTVGGVAPSTGCGASTDVGNQAFVPYQADYYFYQAAA